MGVSKIIAVLTLFLCVTTVSGQSILQDYFKGNKDSLIAEATKLINMPDPFFKASQPTNIDPEVIKEMGFEQAYKVNDYYFTVRDKRKIFAYQFPKKTKNTIILVHGVASTAYLYNKTAGLLQEATQAEVFAIDLRGHGKSEGKAGDVDYINQYADDLADIINIVRKQKPKGKIIIAGHSMGGGITLNYAMMNNKVKVDGYILFAPLLGHNSPAIPTPTGKVYQEEPFMKLHIMRIIGLKMLNDISNHSQDSLPVMFLNLPESDPLRSYSYRANQSMAPDDYKRGLQSVNVPALVLVGNKDEAFYAPAIEKAVLENSKADVIVIEGASHNGIRHHPKSYQAINHWVNKNSLR
ncbi:alpha/beta hydrolase [Thermoflexibacter ruber]|uniref:Lysophospholipase, alpha-beta hydrolase superfamily n=1 Tax=Thermoflexibacter ruber TaxID=1003 RepID=A0A1I2GD49_9BACT|nr:alpha/beta fold hydrolase [Thermoflexibacter ruber]SFF14591.1 Lysophospholipase, alpha-beta hydrolase superfamily [Thermoflexibacter ruber]